MRGVHYKAPLVCAVALATVPLCQASPLGISLKSEPIAGKLQDSTDTKVQSKVDLALEAPLFQLGMNYHVQARVDEEGQLFQGSTSQQVGANLKSDLVDKVLRGKTLVKAQSRFSAGNDQYQHVINPAYTRPLLGIAKLDLGYRYSLDKAASASAEDQTHAYILGLSGALPGGKVNWSGGYESSSKLKAGGVNNILSEGYRLKSDYTVSPELKVQMFTSVLEKTNLSEAAEVRTGETNFGAGFKWQPSSEYALDFNVKQRNLSATGEQILTRRGTLSWFPEDGIQFSLEYDDQLVEGAPGVMFNTTFDLGQF